MSTGFELKADLPLETPDDEKELSQARAECAERIARLLSALPSGPVLRSSKSSTLPKADVPPNQDSGTRIRFLLVDKSGPIAEFESWGDACKYMTDFGCHGASIIRIER